jgi:Fic family protein
VTGSNDDLVPDMVTLPAAERMLEGTPYLISDGSAADRKFHRVITKSTNVRLLAQKVGANIHAQAADVFTSFGLVLRSELVAESNQIEYNNWTSEEVRTEVLRHRELLELPVHSFMESVRADTRVYEVLGLYRAQLVADEWASTSIRPRETEIRQLHGLITADKHYAGRYKTAPNEISGSRHVPPGPADAAEGMHALAHWLESGTGDPALDATLIHAWLVHLHPFEDGNGRIARLLANLVLSQSEYPPLIIRADSDRGEYYDALACSDDGDILPLFELFVRVMRRSVRSMGQPNYVENVIRDRMLTTPSRQKELWQVLAQGFTDEFRRSLRASGLDAQIQGYPSNASFLDLAEGNPDGNSWYLKVTDRDGKPCWLLWFGFNSEMYTDSHGTKSSYPSIFLSTKDDDPTALHPYRFVEPGTDDSVGTEIVLIPGRAKPARVLIGYMWHELSIASVAREAARRLIAAPTH